MIGTILHTLNQDKFYFFVTTILNNNNNIEQFT